MKRNDSIIPLYNTRLSAMSVDEAAACIGSTWNQKHVSVLAGINS